jgi:hypothetical protein
VQEIDKSEFVEIPRFLASAAITHRGAASSEGSSGKLTPEQSETVEKTGFSGPTAPRLRVRLGAPDGRFAFCCVDGIDHDDHVEPCSPSYEIVG